MNKKTRNILKANNKREEMINKENDVILTDIICYLRGANISEYNQELVRADLIEMIIDGQERGENIEQVIGENYKEICDDIINEFPKKTLKEKILESISISFSCIWILGIIWLVMQSITAIVKHQDFNFILSVGDIVNAMLIIAIANIFVTYICKTSLNKSDKKSIMDNKILGFIVAWIVLMAVMLIFIAITYFFNQTVLIVPFYAGIIFIIIVFGLDKVTGNQV
ncbi:hypothetical protein [Intestinibacter sp.]